MSPERQSDSLLAALSARAGGLAVREVVTAVCEAGVFGPAIVAHHRCDLVEGDTLVRLDRRFLASPLLPLLALHEHFVDAGSTPLQACFAGFLDLVEVFRREEDTEE